MQKLKKKTWRKDIFMQIKEKQQIINWLKNNSGQDPENENYLIFDIEEFKKYLKFKTK